MSDEKEVRVYRCVCGQCRKAWTVPVDAGLPPACPKCGSSDWLQDRNGNPIALPEEAA